MQSFLLDLQPESAGEYESQIDVIHVKNMISSRFITSRTQKFNRMSISAEEASV